jgi:hypothetical protein
VKFLNIAFYVFLIGLAVIAGCSKDTPSAGAQAQAASSAGRPASSLPGDSAGRLPSDSSWRTFANPLAIGTKELLLFERHGDSATGDARLWRIDWNKRQITSEDLHGVALDNQRRYTAIANKKGLWLLGPRTVLLQSFGRHLQLDTGYNEPAAIALDDGSILVFASTPAKDGDHMLQLRADWNRIDVQDRGILSYDGKRDSDGGKYHQPLFGYTVAKLLDGNVLVLGGDRTENLASIIHIQDKTAPWTVTPAAPLPHPRVNAAVANMSDGRIVVTGAPSLNCYFDATNVRSVDVYDPAQNHWSSLPALPFTPCADSYGRSAPSISATPSGTLVVGAHLDPHVMVLPHDSNSPNGFAKSWAVYGQFDNERIGGVVQALSDNEVVVAGGAHRDRQQDKCCYATPGFDRVDITHPEASASRALRYIGAATAQQGNLVFAGGGRVFGVVVFGQLRYSAYAELIDLKAGKVRQLPNIPFASGAAQATWLDPDRVVVKGQIAHGDRGFTANENLASYIPKSSGALAVFNLKSNSWSTPISLPAVEDSDLLDAHGNQVTLLSQDGALQHLDMDTGSLRNGDTLPREIRGGTLRKLDGNRLVIAGGEAPSDWISMLDDTCEATGSTDCPDTYIGVGPFAPAASYQRISFGNRYPQDFLSRSAAKDVHASSVAIARDGTVYMLISDGTSEAFRLVQSLKDDPRWRSMPPPEGGTVCRSDCALLIAADPRDPSRDMLFFRQGAISSERFDDLIAKQSVTVWLWNDTSRSWQNVLHTDGLRARATPQALDGIDAGKDNTKIMSMGWHLNMPILWLGHR